MATLTGPALIADDEGGFALDEIAVEPPGPGEVRVRVTAAGLCHTDHASLHWPGPLVMGHEGAGIVESIGDDVTGLETGQPVVLNWAIPCGACFQCDRDQPALCERTHERDPSTLGTSRAHQGGTRWRGVPIERSFHLGTFARYALVRAEAVTPRPADLAAERACILGCAVMTGIGSVINIAEVQAGDSVAVVGCGGVGLNVIQGARLAGAGRIIAIDTRAAPLERARAFGATDVVQAAIDDPRHEALVDRIRAMTGGRGVDHAFEATGIAALAFTPLLLARNGGNAIQVSGAHGEVAVPMTDFFWNKRYLTPLYGGCVPVRDFPRLFDWVESGAIEIDALITHHYRLDEAATAFDNMLNGRSGKGVFTIP